MAGLYRDALLHFVRSRLGRTAQTDKVVEFGRVVEFCRTHEFYAKAVAKRLEALVGRVDDDETLKLVYEIVVLMSSKGVEDARVQRRTRRARAPNTKRVEERRERLRPFVEEMRSEHPSAGPATIATLLRKKKDLKAAKRQTFETDVAALFAELKKTANPI